MSLRERGGGSALVLLALFVPARGLAEDAGTTSRVQASAPPRVEVVLVRIAEQPMAFGQRVTTLFDPSTTVVLEVRPALSSVEVLEPREPGTVYVFVTRDERGRALIYVATREQTGRPARYLLRTVELDAGLDEMGAETIAQVTHSSVMALWSHAAETSQEAVTGELDRGARKPPPAAPSPPPSAPPARRRPPPPPAEKDGPRGLALRAGAQLALHASGDEGLQVSPGAHARVLVLGTFELGLEGSFLVPSRFDVPPVRVRLSGFGAEARASGFVFHSRSVRLRIDASFGVLFMRWQAEEVSTAAGSGWSLLSERESRPYVTVGPAAELPLGSLLNAALRAEVRLLTTPARYDVVVAGRHETGAEVSVAPGLALELSLPQAPGP
jgi:hypothetical protein